MKTKALYLILAAGLLAGIGGLTRLPAATETTGQAEYATLRWAGRENTHLIRPDGTVEFLGPKFVGIKRPEKADERSFFMNLAMNALAREGFELTAMTPDDYVFKRTARH
ncbi:MAG TPA: hypothetical protein VMB21_09225 [Candidatus Limnocylindria bacterium]|jgi:hypothetical protein|nr:hypothetical protein [Candidatus Limnocylindria bacterium]